MIPSASSGRRVSAAATAAVLVLPFLFMGQFIPQPASRFARWDSAGILYVGQALLHGQQYYRDVWDHKPPLFGYINAFGLWLGHGNLWAMWLLNVACLFAAMALLYSTAARLFGRLPALFGLACFAAALVEPLEFTNLTEFYALPLQCCIFYFFAPASEDQVEYRRFALIGLCTGCLALLRPNLVGVTAAVLAGPVLFSSAPSRWRIAVLRAAAAGTAAAACVAIVIAQIALQGNFHAMYEAVITFNARYSSATMGTRFRSLWKGVRELSAHGALPIAAFALLFGRAAKGSPTGKHREFVGTVAIALALEMAMTSISGKGFLHYFLTWCPMLALLGAYAAALVGEAITAPAMVSCATAVVFVCGLGGLYIQYRKPNNPSPYPKVEALAAYLKEHTSPRDTIYQWGEANILYLLSDRLSASPHFYNTNEKWDATVYRRPNLAEVASQLERKRPRYIIDTSLIDNGFPHLGAEDRMRQVPFVNTTDIQPGEIPEEDATPIYEVVARHYDLEVAPQFPKWRLFRLRTGEETPPGGDGR